MKDTMATKVKRLRELTSLRTALDAEIASIQDEIKAEMIATSNYIIVGKDYKITWNEVSTSRIDTKALKEAHPRIAAKFMVTSTYRRFCLT